MKITRNNQGAALLLALLAMLVLLTLGITLLQTGTTEASIAANQVRHTQARYAAEAGLETALVELENDPVAAADPTSYTRNINLQNVEPGNLPLRYEVSVASLGGELYEITAVGYAGKAKYTQTAQATIGSYLDRALTAYEVSESQLSSLFKVNIKGASVINHLYPLKNNTFDPLPTKNPGLGFPELEPDWYKPVTGLVNDQYPSTLQSFANLAPGFSHYIYGSVALTFNGNQVYEFNGELIEGRNGVTLTNYNNKRVVTLKNLRISSSSAITIIGNFIFENVIIYSDSTITCVDTNKSIPMLMNNCLVYGGSTLTLYGVAMSAAPCLLMTPAKLQLIYSNLTGSVICPSISADTSSLTQADLVSPPLIPAGVDKPMAIMQSWGEPPSE